MTLAILEDENGVRDLLRIFFEKNPKFNYEIWLFDVGEFNQKQELQERVANFIEYMSNPDNKIILLVDNRLGGSLKGGEVIEVMETAAQAGGFQNRVGYYYYSTSEAPQHPLGVEQTAERLGRIYDLKGRLEIHVGVFMLPLADISVAKIANNLLSS